MHGDEQRRQPAEAKPVQRTSKHMNSYNGWSNRETWLANLWLDNDQSQGHFLKVAGEVSVSDLAEALEDYYTSTLPELPSGLYADLLAGAVARIDWREIAKRMADDIRSEWSDDVAKEFGDYRSNDEMAAHYCVENGISWEDRNK
jgi:hypothetical protein